MHIVPQERQSRHNHHDQKCRIRGLPRLRREHDEKENDPEQQSKSKVCQYPNKCNSFHSVQPIKVLLLSIRQLQRLKLFRYGSQRSAVRLVEIPATLSSAPRKVKVFVFVETVVECFLRDRSFRHFRLRGSWLEFVGEVFVGEADVDWCDEVDAVFFELELAC